ncbi:hypothetical protein [Lignipirellula cremea]|uniref:KOW domain-containing protein n=1 Tax=Lignipirellula cremea TaxID=2528010 RepID=A0A518E1R8_9BACT|nr:hypothetical protein [Lignipirellula cremea]QDU98012.1 hypothetical protein Pla8534_58730 [Lignipirellula cremea]
MILTCKSAWLSAVLMLFSLFPAHAVQAAPPAEKPALKITPGKVIVPFDRMRRIWGELVSVDLEKQTGVFRNEGDDVEFPFTVMPYAEMLHHATFGDLRDFKIGERAIFRMHENEAGEWVWLTYIQDEMNMLNGHKEYYLVDAIDADRGRIEFTQAKADKSYVRESGLFLETNDETRYWKNGQPAKFSDIQVGDALRAKTHGVGKGRVRVCWHIFLDDESLLKFQAEQMEVHAQRMAEEGLPGYVDVAEGNDLALTLFQEATVVALTLKPGQKIRVAPAGVNRKAIGEGITGTVVSSTRKGKTFLVQLTTDAPTQAFEVGKLARLWAGNE